MYVVGSNCSILYIDFSLATQELISGATTSGNAEKDLLDVENSKFHFSGPRERSTGQDLKLDEYRRVSG